MTLGDIVAAAPPCADEAEAGRAPRSRVRDVARDRLADERRHGLAPPARHRPELTFELLIDEDRCPLHMTYDIIHQSSVPGQV